MSVAVVLCVADLMPERYLFCNNDRYKFIAGLMHYLFKKY